jgi:hypothetical protein
VVKAEDFELKTLLKDQMFWFGMDETPDSANRPLIHGIVTFVRGLESNKDVPSIVHALILSDTLEGRCTAEVALDHTMAAFDRFGLLPRLNLGLSSDSASYMGTVGVGMAARAEAANHYVLIHDPSHLIHNLMTALIDWVDPGPMGQPPPPPGTPPWMKSATAFMSDALTVSKLRELNGVFDRVRKYSRIRWLTIGACAKSVYDQWTDFYELPAGYAFRAASTVPASFETLGETVNNDELVKAKLHLLVLLREKWGPTLEWFESNNPRSYQCLSKIQEFGTIVSDWLSRQDIDLLLDDMLNSHRERNIRENALRGCLERLGEFARRTWTAMATNITDSQIRFWTQAFILDPSQKARRTETDDFYFELFDHMAVLHRVSVAERRGSLRTQFNEYINEPHRRPLANSAEVWDYWVAARRRWMRLGTYALLILAAPIGNSELERSFSLVKSTSLDPHRQNASAENKSAMNRAHVNKDLHLVPLDPF